MGDKTLSKKRMEALMQSAGQKAWQSMQNGQFDAAEKLYSEAIDYARRVHDRAAHAIFLSYLAIARQQSGRGEQSQADLKECLQIANELDLPQIKAHASLLLGEYERARGDSEAAVKHFLSALEASLNCHDDVSIEMSFGNLGLVYLEKGWAEQASECFRQALERAGDSPNKAAWLGSLGQCLAELGQFDQALQQYSKAFEAALACGNIVSQSICRGSEGNAYFEQGDYEGAAASYVSALTLSKQSGDPGRAGIWLGNLSNAYRKLNKQQEAIAACEEALEIARSLKDVHSEAAHLDSLGECYMSAGDAPKALESYEQALDISRQIEDRQGQRIYLSNLGRCHHRMGQFEPAFEALSRAIDLFDEQRSRIKSDDLKTSFAARGQDLYRDMVSICLTMGRRVEALEFVGRAKSRAILDLLSNSPIDVSELSQGDDEMLNKLVNKEAQLRNQITRLERIYWQAPPPESGSRGAAYASEDSQKIYTEWRETVNQLRRYHPNYANLIAVESLTFANIKALWKGDSAQHDKQPLLPANTALIEYYWTDQFFLAGAMFEGASEPVLHIVESIDALSAMRSDLSDFLVMSSTEGWDVPLSICQRLYDLLMAPLAKSLPESIERLIFIPHGTLYRLPFAALHDGKNFLIERFAISYLPTVSLIPVLARAQENARSEIKETTKYLVSAISDYSATRKDGMILSNRLRSAAGLEDLRYTMDEARTVADVGAKNAIESKLLTNEEVKKELPALFGAYNVVHFAGHAVFNPEEPLASGLVLSDGTMLTAAAILQGNVLRTHCGKLLVLSACQTGVNMVTPGGEILGLARALMYAGMPNLILSLWEVADRSTSDLMKEFHNTWQGGTRTVAVALQEAQRKAAREKQPVHAWAPFIHLGID